MRRVSVLARVPLSLTRRARTALGAGGTVLASPSAPDVLRSVTDLLNVTIVGLLAYESTTGSGLLGLRLSWLFVGYVVFEYTPELYPDSFGDIVDRWGFRLVAAGTALAMGLLSSVLGGIVPPAVAFGVVPSGGPGATAAVLLVGSGSVAAAVGYVRLVRGERLVGPDSDLFEAFDAFTVDEQARLFERAQALPTPLRRLLFASTAVAVAAVLVVPAALLGVTFAVVNAFYPLPELVVFGGLLVAAVLERTRLSGAVEDWPPVDVELFAAERAVDAVRNLKGLVLVAYCSAGLFLCALAFLVWVGLVGTAGPELVETVALLAGGGSVPRLGFVVGRLWLVVGVFVLLFVYAAYGLLYWLAQLARIPAYARHWERRRQGRVDPPPTPGTARPPWLFVPADLLLVLLAGLLAVGAPEALSTPVVVGFGVAWPVAVGAVGLSAYRWRRSSPQAVAAEDRAVVAAVVLQQLGVAALGFAAAGGPAVVAPVDVGVLLLLVVAFAYFPEVGVYAERKTGAGGYVHVLYAAGLFALALPVMARLGLEPGPVYGLVAVLLVLLAVFSYLDQRVDG